MPGPPKTSNVCRRAHYVGSWNLKCQMPGPPKTQKAFKRAHYIGSWNLRCQMPGPPKILRYAGRPIV